MKFLFLALVTLFALPQAQAAESADGTKVTCTGETTATVTRKNGLGYDDDESQSETIFVKGNERVARGTVVLRSAYKSKRSRSFNVEVFLGFSDGHAEKQIKVGTTIAGQNVSTESALTNESAVSMKVNGLDVHCRID